MFYRNQGNLMKERRKADRFEIQEMIKLSLGRQEAIEAQGLNISEYGICCLVNKEIKKMSRVSLILNIPVVYDDKKIVSEGIVAWAAKTDAGFEIGIEFFLLKDDARENIKAFMRTLHKKV